MELGVKDNTAIVTAAGSGLGKATARVFAREGANLVLNDLHEENLTEAVSEIENVATGGEIVTVQGDLTDPDDISELVTTAAEEFDDIDHLVTSSGGPSSGPFIEMDDSDWDFAHELLLMSVVRLCREAYPHLKKNEGGTIVNSTSRSVKEAIDGLVLSNAVRSSVAGLSKTLSMEFAPEVRTNIVMPGPTETQRMVDLIESGIERGEYDNYDEGRKAKSEGIPLGRVGDPQEFGEFVTFLSSERASYINGAAIPIDGGAMASNV